MNSGHAAQHFVARQLQAHRDVAATLRLAHRFHTATHDFLFCVAAERHPNTKEDDDDDQECEREYEQSHNESSRTSSLSLRDRN
jgi:hypothetical protein